jgi:peptidoglycan/LPS O-acetylase OafA/YrhL
MTLKQYPALNGVRAVAALMVMVFHFFQDLTTKNNVLLLVKKYAVFGQTGVTLFFVLSGFLITRILLNTKQSPAYFLNFYARRALRIFPLYYLFLIIYYFLIPILEHSAIVPFNQQIWFWVYLQNIAYTFRWNITGPIHFWSLAVEEHFYLFFPMLIYFLDKSKIKFAIIFIMIFAFLVRLILVKIHLEPLYFTFSRVDELAIGAFLAILEVNNTLNPRNARKFTILFGIIIIPTLILWTFTTGMKSPAVQVSKITLLALTYFSLIGHILSIKEEHWIKKILSHQFLAFTGKISYGLYVYHPLCFLLVHKYFGNEYVLVDLTVSFMLSFMVAIISYYLFEVKFLALKKKFEF